MSWSLKNHMVADQVAALLDEDKDAYGPEVKRFYPRETALAIIHSAIWGYGCREDSTAGCYAAMNLFEALGLKGWTFAQDEADALQEFRKQKYAALYGAAALQEDPAQPTSSEARP